MFDIHSVELTNFRSYKGKHLFEFPTAPGLYSITGQNLDNPRLGPNGVGKSTLLDAIYWCLYGRTSRGLKAGDVVTWHTAKGCHVTVCLTVAQKRALISRGQSPNLLTLNGEIIDQQALQAFLGGIGPTAFEYAVMLPQFGQSFFDLAPAAKLTLFSQIMALEFWLEKSEGAKAASTQLEGKRNTLEQELAKTQGQIEGAKTDIKELKAKALTFDQEQDAAVTKLENELRDLMRSAKKDEAQLQDIKKILLDAEVKLAKLTQELKLITQQQQQSENQRAVLQEQLKGLGHTSKQLRTLDAKCPTCLQPIDKGHLKAERAKALASFEAKVAEVGDLDKVLDGFYKKSPKLHEDKEAVEQNRRDFERNQNRVSNQIANTEARCKKLNAEINAECNRPNPYELLLGAKNKLLKTATEQLAVLKGKIEAVNAEHAAVSYWVNGFKRVRLFIIEETLRQLELEVNNNLTGLGLTDWRIEFDVERENKSGGITKGFVVLVHPPGHAEPVKYEAYSGGETQRLRLAGDLGLANLIMERAGLTNTIEFYDEPSAHLSQEGLLDLAETLADRAVTTGKRIFLVDHHVLDYGGFTGSYTVVKGPNGSSVQAS